jgi:Rps23 Pro-64 3,4-dihydroxylase Tpa1-like proline 4-hydroxylase
MSVSYINPLDKVELRSRYQSAEPFPHMVIDNFLQPDLADEAARSFFSFDEARQRGIEFQAVNENLKIQIVDPNLFPEAIAKVASALASAQFMSDLSYITGINNLVWDQTYAGGGMHQTARSGWLDVHVDFNFNEALQMHRRLNILVYLNPKWEESWGGELELWDAEVRHCRQRVQPLFNRCAVFTTNDISFHGVTAVTTPPDVQRCSFAAYYYTREAPVGWDGQKHSTIFRARPDEHMKRHLLMPAETARRAAARGVGVLKDGFKKLVQRD